MQLLLDKGWKMYYSCMCGGSKKEYYSHPLHKAYEIRLRPTKNVFSLLMDNRIIVGPIWAYKLEETLKAHELLA